MKALKEIRLSKNMTQAALAKKARCSTSTIYAYESGRRKDISSNLVKRFAKILGTTVKEISKEIVEEPLDIKDCLNQGCALNYNKKCQSMPVCKGAYCQNQDLITSKQIKVKRRGKFQLKI